MLNEYRSYIYYIFLTSDFVVYMNLEITNYIFQGEFMKMLIFAVLFLPILAWADFKTTTLVSKSVTLTFQFSSSTPFSWSYEYGECTGSSLKFQYAYIEEKNIREFLPILRGQNELSNDCADRFDSDPNDKLIAALNSHVVNSGFLHSLTVEARYKLSQLEDESSLVLHEDIEFSLPELPKPFQYSVWQKISK